MKSATVLNTEISVTSVEEVSELLNSEKRLSVAVCNVNTVVTCYRNKSINKIINSFDTVSYTHLTLPTKPFV